MALSVIRTNRGLVQPSKNTPSETLDLSIIDKIPVLRCNARTLHVFKHGPGAAQVIREALARALVPYYPLAGRLKESEYGELQVECCGDGVWFVEASAECMLDSVYYFDDTESIPYDELLPDQFPEGINPLVLMQVTQFGCGGFVMGLIFCHSICDGLGAAQFLNAVGEMARGLGHPSIMPAWCRDFSPSPSPSPPKPQQSNPIVFPNSPPPMPDYHLQHANIDISQDQINQLKQEFHDSTSQTCSAFEIVAATVWRNRTQSINLSPNTQVVKLVFFANCRQFLQPPPPPGFYGNCFFPVTITAPSQKVARSSISEVVKLIREAKSKLGNEFWRWVKGENGEDDPFAPPLDYTTLFVSEWGRLGFNQIDYGWGEPVHVVPIQGSAIIPACIVGLLPSPKKGIRLMTWCVEDAHRQPFLDLMIKF